MNRIGLADVFGVVGFVSITAGTWSAWGMERGLMMAGGVLLALGLASALREANRRGHS